MITLKIDHTGLAVSNLGALVVGNINSISAGFEFSSEWAELNKIAVFSNGSTKVSVALSENSCAIPWEVLTSAGEVFVSLRGVGSGGSFVLCTEEVSLGKVSASSASQNAALAGSATASVIDTLVTDVAGLMGVSGTGINSLTEENDLSDSDALSFFDASAETTRKTPWSNVKAKLKAYFDTLYNKVTNTSELTNDSGFLTAHQDISGKQDKAITAAVTIAAADWSGDIIVTKNVTGVTSANTVICDSSDSSVQCTAQGEGTLTFTAAATPTEAVSVKAVILP